MTFCLDVLLVCLFKNGGYYCLSEVTVVLCCNIALIHNLEALILAFYTSLLFQGDIALLLHCDYVTAIETFYFKGQDFTNKTHDHILKYNV